MAPSEQTDPVPEDLERLGRQGFQLFQEKLYPQALEVQQRLVALTEQRFGAHHPYLGVALLNRGRLYRLIERNDECEADYVRALDILRPHPESHAEQIVWLLNNLSALYRNTNRRGQEEPYQRELLAIERAALPPGDPRLANALIGLASACLALDRVPEVVELLGEALAVRTEALGAGHPQTLEIREMLTALGVVPVNDPESTAATAPRQTAGAMTPQQCLEAFARHEYAVAADGALALMRSTSVPSTFIHVFLISLLRLGAVEDARRFAEGIPALTANLPWDRALLRITTGEADPAAVIAAARDDAQRGEALFYAAARELTEGRPDAARELLRECVHSQSGREPTVEDLLAQRELEFLGGAQPHPPA
jgi:tetratricopeptide (TPR) repeat protein